MRKGQVEHLSHITICFGGVKVEALLPTLNATDPGESVGFTFNLCKKNCSVYIQCKGDIMVVDIKQHKSQFKKFKHHHYTMSEELC